jgi:molybdopterin molybdotransferase
MRIEVVSLREEQVMPGDDAGKIMLDNIKGLEAADKPLLACGGHVAAENICADLGLPRSAISGQDGYAVKSQDINGVSHNSPVVLRITARARAGRPSNRVVRPDTACRIMTGSALPRGADCVVRFEDTDGPANKNGPNKNNPSKVTIYVTATPGANIRPAGK